MTSPNGALPDGASSGTPGRSVARLAGYTEQSLLTATSTQLARSYQNIPRNFAVAVQAGLHEFGASLCEAITGFTGGLIDLRGWAVDLRARAQRAREDATTALGAADIAVAAVSETSDVVQGANSRVQVVVDGLPIRPYWDTMNLTEEASFPRAMLHARAWDISDTAKPGYTEYYYIYVAYYQNNLPVYATRYFYLRFTPVFTPPANTLDGAYIRCRYNGGRKVVTYIPDAVSTPCELYVVVGRMAGNGDVRIEWVSPNQTPLITTARFERSVVLPDELIFDVGETAFVGIHQRGSGNPRPLLGIESTALPRAAGAWPPRAAARFATSTVLQLDTVLAAGTLDHGGTTVAYVALSQDLSEATPSKLAFYEDFDAGALPKAFGRMTSLSAVVSAGAFVVSGGGDGPRRYLYGQSLNYDDVAVTGRVIAPTVRHAWLMLRSTPDNKSFVSLNVTQSSIGVYRFADATWTPLTTTQTTVASGDVVRLRADGNLYTAQRKTATGWVDVLTYTDTAGQLPSGSGHRYTGLGNERFDWVDGGGWDYWKAEDL
ncbi:hypothetical protein ACWEKT_35880 [Nocardia takedensis]